MHRRSLLRALPAAVSLALAGCLDRARSALDRESEVRELDSGFPCNAVQNVAKPGRSARV